MKRKMLALFVVVFASAAIAKDMEVEIVGYPKEIPRGITQIPLNVEIRSKRPLTIWQIRDSLVVTDDRGRRLPRCPVQGNDGPIWGMFWPDPKVQAIPAGWSYLWASGMWCADWDGDLLVRALVRGESARAVKALDSDHPLWRGEIRSQDVHIRYVEPTGVDKEAYDAFGASPMRSRNLGALIKVFPTSIYAAYAVYATCSGLSRWKPRVALESIEDEWKTGYETGNSIPDDTGESKDGWQSLKGDELWKVYDRWIRQVLASHPDMWFANDLRLSGAVIALRRKSVSIALDRFRELANDSSAGVIQERAKEYLSLMLADGMIKPEAIPAELRAKLPKVEPVAKKPVAKD